MNRESSDAVREARDEDKERALCLQEAKLEKWKKEHPKAWEAAHGGDVPPDPRDETTNPCPPLSELQNQVDETDEMKREALNLANKATSLMRGDDFPAVSKEVKSVLIKSRNKLKDASTTEDAILSKHKKAMKAANTKKRMHKHKKIVLSKHKKAMKAANTKKRMHKHKKIVLSKHKKAMKAANAKKKAANAKKRAAQERFVKKKQKEKVVPVEQSPAQKVTTGGGGWGGRRLLRSARRHELIGSYNVM